MKRILLLLLSVFLFSLNAEEIDCSKAISTPEINACAAKELAAKEKVLEDYLEKAYELKKPEQKVVQSLKESQTTWLRYRKSYCSGVYELWSGGTIRGAMYNGCMIRLTKERTHIIWSDYLTYMDSTPPALPEPSMND
ncbi:MAG: DUF1311 domain-containing protein [Bdellovibrionales bacterium]|nr:DUF1311 domain-containing protein [Bdellovibrionales bacterium]